MRRLLMLIGVAAVAGAMYVAAASGSQRSTGPTAKQFKALKTQVASLSKKLKNVKSEADLSVEIIGTCYLTLSGNTASFVVAPVSQRGSATDGYLFGTSPATAIPQTALDINTASPQAYLQEVNSPCVTGGALKHGAVRSGMSRLQLWAERGR